MTDLRNKVALITASARGIGKGVAERYAALGANIAVNYTRDEAAAHATVAHTEKLGTQAIAVQVDVAQVRVAAGANLEVRVFLANEKCSMLSH